MKEFQADLAATHDKPVEVQRWQRAERVVCKAEVTPADYYGKRKLNPRFVVTNLEEEAGWTGTRVYEFYSGHMGVALQSDRHHRSQYELWNYEDSLQGREVAIVMNTTARSSAGSTQ